MPTANAVTARVNPEPLARRSRKSDARRSQATQMPNTTKRTFIPANQGWFTSHGFVNLTAQKRTDAPKGTRKYASARLCSNQRQIDSKRRAFSHAIPVKEDPKTSQMTDRRIWLGCEANDVASSAELSEVGHNMATNTA